MYICFYCFLLSQLTLKFVSSIDDTRWCWMIIDHTPGRFWSLCFDWSSIDIWLFSRRRSYSIIKLVCRDHNSRACNHVSHRLITLHLFTNHCSDSWQLQGSRKTQSCDTILWRSAPAGFSSVILVFWREKKKRQRLAASARPSRWRNRGPGALANRFLSWLSCNPRCRGAQRCPAVPSKINFALAWSNHQRRRGLMICTERCECDIVSLHGYIIYTYIIEYHICICIYIYIYNM